MEATHQTVGGVQVVEQAVAVLDALARPSEQQSVRELALQVGVSKSTVHRIVVSLAKCGLLEFDASTEKYGLGSRLVELARSVPRRTDLIGAAEVPMDRLWRLTEESVVLSVLSEDARITIHQRQSPHGLRFTAEVGTRYPLNAGASGRVLLASMPPGTASEVLSRTTLEPVTSATPTDRQTLLAHLAKVQEQGYAVSYGEVVPGGACIAVPIRAAEGRLAALSLYVPTARLDPGKIDLYVPLLKREAGEIAESWQDRSSGHWTSFRAGGREGGE